MRKKALLFVAVMAAFLSPCHVWAYDFSYTYQGQTLYYNIVDGTAEVTYQQEDYYNGYYANLSGAVTIPSSVTFGNATYTVTSIGNVAFAMCSGLTTVTIPNTVTSIGNSAFYGCSGLTSVAIPNSITSIGNYAFYGDSNLVNAAIPSTVDYIGQSAFAYCSSLTSVNLPEGLTIINGWAFFHCSSLTSIVIPDNVTIIDSSAFSECYNLTSITFGSNVETINDWAFSLCGMTSVTIPPSVTRIGEYAFGGTHMQSVTIPENVTYLGSYSFGSTDTVYLLRRTSDYWPPTTTGIIVVPCGQRAGFVYAWSGFGGISQHIYDPCVQAGTFTLINHGGGYFAYVDFTQYDDNGYNVQVIVSDTTILVSETPVTQALLFASFANGNYGYTPNLTRVTYNGTEIDLSSITSADYGDYVMYRYNTGLPGVYEAWFGDAGEPEEYNVIVMSSDESLGEVESYYDGESAYAYAYAYGGAVFNGWSNGSMENPLTLTVTSDTTLIALFSSASASVTDTLWMHDTTTVVDTVTLTEYVPVHDTTYINVHDTSYIILTDTLTMTLYDTIWLYDTVVIHDTIYITQEGVDGAETANAKIYQRDGHVVVEGVELQTVTFYDAVGRVMAVKRNEGDTIRFNVPASGTYLVKVGAAPARRIVVVR